ncbi:MAG: hypothetical protein ACOYB3_01670 [Azonexus sp.]
MTQVGKVYWRNPDGTRNVNHDDLVREAVQRIQAACEAFPGLGGVGVIDFADATVIYRTQSAPEFEVVVADRKTENSILAGGFA